MSIKTDATIRKILDAATSGNYDKAVQALESHAEDHHLAKVGALLSNVPSDNDTEIPTV